MSELEEESELDLDPYDSYAVVPRRLVIEIRDRRRGIVAGIFVGLIVGWIMSTIFPFIILTLNIFLFFILIGAFVGLPVGMRVGKLKYDENVVFNYKFHRNSPSLFSYYDKPEVVFIREYILLNLAFGIISAILFFVLFFSFIHTGITDPEIVSVSSKLVIIFWSFLLVFPAIFGLLQEQPFKGGVISTMLLSFWAIFILIAVFIWMSGPNLQTVADIFVFKIPIFFALPFAFAGYIFAGYVIEKQTLKSK